MVAENALFSATVLSPFNLREIKQQLRERMHDPVRQTGQWLKSIVQGHFNYCRRCSVFVRMVHR